MFGRLLMAIGMAILLSGCVVENISTTVEQTIKGDYFLKSDKYDQGRESFEREVAEQPHNPLARYYYGRFLLQAGEAKMALEQLKTASDLSPGNADYQFWTGVAYGENGNEKKEEDSYRKALSRDDDHLQSLIYLGHSLLKQERYEEALVFYSRALKIWPGSPSALYNRGLILNRLGRSPEEKQAWLIYLTHFPSGAMARQATSHLNRLGDFTYRNHVLGVRTITTEKIWFDPFTARLSESSFESLEVIGSIFSRMEKGKLQIVTYQKNDKMLARKKAVACKRFLLENFSGIPSNRIGISWFAEPQTVSIGNKKLKIDDSVSFFISD